jgi:NAD(P)-dependent dehydrogenase (short-subunit alcohol dehydrogenase family)
MRNVLITGCSSGIGYCVAKGLKARGYNVFASARKLEDVARLEAEGFKTLLLDLANPESVQDAVYELMLRTNSELYAVFHNGAYGQAGALEDITRATLEKQFATNVFGWHQLTNMLLPLMRQRNEGRIIYNSSLLGYVALPFRGSYNASKYAIEGLADTLRLELADTDIKLSLIEPGPIESRFRANALQSLQANVDIEKSPYRDKYQATIRRLSKPGPAAPFTLPPEAVLQKVIHALESPKPKPRYRVTFPAHLFWTLRRLLPTRLLDKVLLKVPNG